MILLKIINTIHINVMSYWLLLKLLSKIVEGKSVCDIDKSVPWTCASGFNGRRKSLTWDQNANLNLQFIYHLVMILKYWLKRVENF